MKFNRHCFLCFSLLIVFLTGCIPPNSNFNLSDGSAEVIMVSDSMLNDSSIITGRVYEAGYPDENIPVQGTDVWIDKTNLTTVPDTTGYFQIKIQPGTYTVVCERDFNDWSELIEKVKNINVQKNKKVVINFYLGVVSE